MYVFVFARVNEGEWVRWVMASSEVRDQRGRGQGSPHRLLFSLKHPTPGLGAEVARRVDAKDESVRVLDVFCFPPDGSHMLR